MKQAERQKERRKWENSKRKIYKVGQKRMSVKKKNRREKEKGKKKAKEQKVSFFANMKFVKI